MYPIKCEINLFDIFIAEKIDSNQEFRGDILLRGICNFKHSFIYFKQKESGITTKLLAGMEVGNGWFDGDTNILEYCVLSIIRNTLYI